MAKRVEIQKMAPRVPPTIAWVLGDPVGIGPEIIAKSLANPEMKGTCRPLVVGPAWLLERGMQMAQVKLATTPCDPTRIREAPVGRIPVVDVGWQLADFPPGKPSAEAGKLSIEMLHLGVGLARNGTVDAVVFGPLNKEALRLGGNPHRDELHLVAEWLGESECSEINAAAGLFTTRVTSHVPLKDVSGLLDPDKIVKAVRLLHRTLVWAGVENPTVAVAALNPHGGERGLCGTEELTVIEPGVAKSREAGIPVVGPFPADTIFVRAKRGEFQGVVTMYHDQGQIATKLLGFDHGVTIMGGLSVIVMTPAHGTAFDIVGKGVANPGAFQAAVRLAAHMAGRKRP